MRTLLSTFLDRPPRPRPFARPGVEALEDRTALSFLASPGAAAPTHGGACACPGCAAAEYRIGGTGSASTAGGYKWAQAALGQPVTITYSFSNLLNGRLGGALPAAALKATIQEALGRWAAVAPLRFVEVADGGPAPSNADYAAAGRPMIRFGHLPIDGAYSVLAYAYYPGTYGLAGDVLFDTAERWTLNPAAGTDLLEVATHEIGHALGLDHQPSGAGGKVAIMNPYYASRFRGLGTSFLYLDDVQGIRALYGAGTGSVTPRAGGGVTPPAPDPNPTPGPAPNPAFVVQGTTLFVNGTAGNDTFRYSAASGVPAIEVNGVAYGGSLSGLRAVSFAGKGGKDVLTLAGGPQAEAFTLSAGTAAVSGGAYALAARGMTTLVAAAGAGDRLVLNGTAGADAFTASPAAVTLTAGSSWVIATGFRSAVLNAGAGADAAALTGSTGNDLLTATPTQAVLSGTGYSLTANGFDRVTANALTGYDQATLFGSAGGDAFTSLPASSSLKGAGFFNLARGFDAVTGHAGGGADAAFLYDGAGSDTFTARPGEARMSGAAYANAAVGFDRVVGYSTAGGADTARLYDSAGDDVFVSLAGAASMSGAGAVSVARGFRVVVGTASGGNDRATLYDGAANDVLGGSGAAGYLARGADAAYFRGFDVVSAVGAYGGTNRKASGPFTFRLALTGQWV